MALEMYYEHLNSLKTNGINQKEKICITELIKNFINELNVNSRRDIRIYKKCKLEYMLYPLLHYSYNEDILEELTYLIKEAKFQKECLRDLVKILINTQNSASNEIIIIIYEIVLDIANLQKQRKDYFDYITIIDSTRFKNITYIPGKEIPTDNKELVKKIDTSLIKLSKVMENI